MLELRCSLFKAVASYMEQLKVDEALLLDIAKKEFRAGVSKPT